MTESQRTEEQTPRREIGVDEEVADVLEEITDSSPKGEALDRFERMIDVQIETLNGIDNKAEYLTRFVGILLGVVLTGLSLIPKFDGVTLTVDSFPMLVSVFTGVTGLLSTLGFAIITYLSSKFKYGVSPGVAKYFADTDVTEEEYSELLLRGYADIISQNRKVVRVNSRRFRNALASLLVGLGFLSLATFFLVVSIPVYAKYGVLLGSVSVMSYVLKYVLAEEYLTLNREVVNNE